MRLIDADALTERINNLKSEICSRAAGWVDEDSYECGAVDGLLDALKYIEEAKEAVPRLLTPEEIQTMEAGTPLVVERYIKHDGKIVPMACWAINTGKLILSFHGTMFPDTVNKIPYATIVQNREGKGHHNEYFRFWSDRPTNEQMKNEPWEGVKGDGC